MSFRGEATQMRNWTDAQKLEYVLQLHKEVSENYEAITKLALLAYSRNFRLIIENPANKPHYLTSYWPIKPAFIDKNRRENGDYQKKPTQFFFINCEPKQTLLFEPLEETEHRVHERINVKDGLSRQTLRSMIHPQYARRFIKQYIL